MIVHGIFGIDRCYFKAVRSLSGHPGMPTFSHTHCWQIPHDLWDWDSNPRPSDPQSHAPTTTQREPVFVKLLLGCISNWSVDHTSVQSALTASCYRPTGSTAKLVRTLGLGKSGALSKLTFFLVTCSLRIYQPVLGCLELETAFDNWTL